MVWDCRAVIGGVSLAELNALELEFLITIDFDLIVRREEYDALTGWLMAWSMAMTDVHKETNDAGTDLSILSQNSSRKSNQPREREQRRGRSSATRRRPPTGRDLDCEAVVATASLLAAVELE
jgi:hypothetical protein